MIKVKEIKFNLITFIIKAALVVLSIAVSLLLLMFFEQNGLLFKGVNLRSDMLFNNSNFRINEKELERLITGSMPTFFITKSIISLIFKLALCLNVGLVEIACLVVAVLLKKVSASLKEFNEVKQHTSVVENNQVCSYDTINSLNLTLTI